MVKECKVYHVHMSLQGQQEINWYSGKGIKQQSLNNNFIQGWTLYLNWTDQKLKTEYTVVMK